MKIIDCFTFYNELEMLEYRLKTLYDTVDYFVLSEATLTHVGKSKKMYYDKNKFKEYADKIIHVIVDDFPFNEHNINIQNENIMN
jgi:beta-1,4-mannosyl-glycoprotein beta-1,4-N-acetylglucosaminyltransferase